MKNRFFGDKNFLSHVCKKKQHAKRQDVLLSITLDVKNAFKSARFEGMLRYLEQDFQTSETSRVSFWTRPLECLIRWPYTSTSRKESF